MFHYVSVLHSFSMAEKYSILWVYHNLFNHSLVDGHLGYFPFWAIMNNVMNIFVQVFVYLNFQFHWVYT